MVRDFLYNTLFMQHNKSLSHTPYQGTPPPSDVVDDDGEGIQGCEKAFFNTLHY